MGTYPILDGYLSHSWWVPPSVNNHFVSYFHFWWSISVLISTISLLYWGKSLLISQMIGGLRFSSWLMAFWWSNSPFLTMNQIWNIYPSIDIYIYISIESQFIDGIHPYPMWQIAADYGHCAPNLSHALVEDVYTDWRSMLGHVDPLFHFLEAQVFGSMGYVGIHRCIWWRYQPEMGIVTMGIFFRCRIGIQPHLLVLIPVFCRLLQKRMINHGIFHGVPSFKKHSKTWSQGCWKPCQVCAQRASQWLRGWKWHRWLEEKSPSFDGFCMFLQGSWGVQLLRICFFMMKSIQWFFFITVRIHWALADTSGGLSDVAACMLCAIFCWGIDIGLHCLATFFHVPCIVRADKSCLWCSIAWDSRHFAGLKVLQYLNLSFAVSVPHSSMVLLQVATSQVSIKDLQGEMEA